jgi:AraC-like DNA-binding protein
MNQSVSMTVVRSPRSGSLDRFVASHIHPIGFDVTEQSPQGITDFSGIQLGHLDVFRYEGIGRRRVHRSLHHIQADQVSDVILCMPIHARAHVSHYGSTARLEPGSFIMYSGLRPVDCDLFSLTPGGKFSCIHVRIAAPYLRRRLSNLDDCLDHPIAIRRGAGHIMRSLIELALMEADALSSSQSIQIGSMLIDAIAATAGEAPEIAMQSEVRRRSANARLFEQATRLIEDNLSNPFLNAELVADHCRVSSRHLRNVFAQASTTVGAYIREMRLQQCRAALRSPRLQDQTVTQIALSWGFNDPAHFSRLYRKRFGLAPSQDRLPSHRHHCFEASPHADIR